MGLEPTTFCLLGRRSKPTELIGIKKIGPTGSRTQASRVKV
jgi:hypothetical protein